MKHILRFHGIFSNGGGSRQISDIEDQNGRFFFQERSWFPWNWNKKERIVYWACNQIFTNLSEAKEASKQWGAINVQEGFYCDENAPHWFLVFDDADKCLAFVAHKTECDLEWLSA